MPRDIDTRHTFEVVGLPNIVRRLEGTGKHEFLVEVWVSQWSLLATLCFLLGVLWYIVTLVVTAPANVVPGAPELSRWERSGLSLERSTHIAGVGPNTAAVLELTACARHVRRRIALRFRPSLALASVMTVVGSVQYLLTMLADWAGGLGWSLLSMGVLAGSLTTLAATVVLEHRAWRLRAPADWRFAEAFASIDWNLLDEESDRRTFSVISLRRLEQQLTWSGTSRHPSELLARARWNDSLHRLNVEIALIHVGQVPATKAGCLAWVERACRLLRTGDTRRWARAWPTKAGAIMPTARRGTRGRDLVLSLLAVSAACVGAGLWIVRSDNSPMEITWFDPSSGVLGVISTFAAIASALAVVRNRVREHGANS